MRFTAEAPGARLAARERRPGGEPLLLLHGEPGIPDSMQTTIAPLLPQMRAISFDQRGASAKLPPGRLRVKGGGGLVGQPTGLACRMAGRLPL